MTELSSRFGLPLLAGGQAQKEITHNEALALVDALLCPVVEAVAPATVPSAPQPGQCWIVGSSPDGAWTGQAHKLAVFTEGGWRFVSLGAGVSVWSRADSVFAQRGSVTWEIGKVRALEFHANGQKVIGPRLSSISDPSGGTVVDAEARASVAAILGRMRSHGLIDS